MISLRYPGDPRVDGYWRVHCERLRSLTARLSNMEVKVYIFMQASPRRNDGSPMINEGRVVSGQQIAVGRATLHRALAALVKMGLIEITEAGAGRRPTFYRLAPAEAQGVRKKTKGRQKSPTTPVRQNTPEPLRS
jgi:hypothetical protein